MNIVYNGKLYVFDKNINQREDIFYDRCWYIAKSNSLTEEDIDKNKQLADIYINMKYLGCRYSKRIEQQITF